MTRYLLIVALSVLFTACGGSGGDTRDSNSGNIINIPSASGATTLAIGSSAYTKLQSGDVIVRETDDTTIKIRHNVNGEREVTVLTGSAHILRK